MDFIGNLLSGLVGALIAVWLSHRSELKRSKQEGKGALISLLKGIKTEIISLKEIHDKGAGEKLKNLENDKPFNFFYPIQENYFMVLEGQSALLGTLEDDELRKAIIETYIRLKGLVDSFRMNNHVLEKCENYTFLYQETKLEIYKIRADACLFTLISYSVTLKNFQSDTYEKLRELVYKIDLYLNSHTKKSKPFSLFSR